MNASDFTYGPLADVDVPAAGRLVHHAFGGPQDGAEKWLRDGGVANGRGLRDLSGRLAASLLRIEMGQFFGGRAVPMLGIAGVAVAPEARGRGLARRLMQSAMIEAAEQGWPISTLYASTLSLYRQVGYEQAGHRFIITLPVCRIDVRERAGDLRPLGPDDEEAVRACYARFARLFNGTLDRGAYVWRRLRELREVKYTGFGLDDPAGGLAAYLFLAQTRDPRTGDNDLTLSDVTFTSAGAGRRLLGFLADFGTLGENITFAGSPLHPLLSLMSARRYAVEKKDYWMVRVVSIKRALEARGYPAGVVGTVHFELRDDLLPANAGTWRLRVEGGGAEAERLDGPRQDAIRCDVRGLSAIYTGLYTPRQAALLGWAEGPAESLDAAGAVFGGFGTPWMGDMF